jgi:glycosyltransferase involved in cell wall biosynthesis
VGDLVRVGSVIVVDDASTDTTGACAEAAGAIVVRNAVNVGYGASIEAGFQEAIRRGALYVVTADGDGQHEPTEVAHVASLLLDDGYELVVGSRSRQLRAVERLCAWYAKRKYGVVDPLCGLKGYHVRFFTEYGGFDKHNSVGMELMLFALRNGARWTQIPVTIHPRHDGASRFYASVRGNLRILRGFWAMIQVGRLPLAFS